MELTRDLLLEYVSYDPETGLFTWLRYRNNRIKVGDVACRPSKRLGYRILKLFGKSYMAHRVAWLVMTGDWPPGMIDHKDRVRDNNRFDNLRLADYVLNGQNQCNAQRGSSSKFLGVFWNTKSSKWQAGICFSVGGKKKYKYLGLFDDEKDAGRAYMDAKPIYHPGALIA